VAKAAAGAMAAATKAAAGTVAAMAKAAATKAAATVKAARRRGWLDNEVVLMLGLPAGDVKWLACRGLKVHLVEGG